MTARRIAFAFAVLFAASVLGATALVLYVRSEAGVSALERLERSPDWRGIGTYTVPER